MYCYLIFRFKKAVFKPHLVYGLSPEDMSNRSFLSLFKATVTVPPFSLMLQTVVYTFGHFCGESWENEDRENFSSENLEVVLADKMDNSTKGCIRYKNKSLMGMIFQRRGNFFVAFLWALTGDSLAPDVCSYVSNGPWGAEVPGEVLQDCATAHKSAACLDGAVDQKLQGSQNALMNCRIFTVHQWIVSEFVACPVTIPSPQQANPWRILEDFDVHKNILVSTKAAL